MHNQDIREEVAGAGLKLWQIADKLGMYDGNFSRKLRKELSAEEKEKIRGIIKELQARKDVSQNETHADAQRSDSPLQEYG